jgi:prepilin-type N-terminal cleavage/methylation domain-containing protein
MKHGEKTVKIYGEEQTMIDNKIIRSELRTHRGVTIIELLVVLSIFSVVMAGLYSSYSVQMKAGVREYRLAESEMEFQIGKMVLERDLAMAGYGIADDYSALATSFTPTVAAATNANPDTLTITGTALGRESRAAQAWSYTMIDSAATTSNYYPFATPASTFQDARENLRPNDVIIYMNPTTRTLLASSLGANPITNRSWLFPFPQNGAPSRPDPLEMGVVAYGLQTQPTGTAPYADTPYYTVKYSLGGTPPSYCEPTTQNLLRSEDRQNPAIDQGQPIFNCVLDFQVAFGIDTTEDGLIDCWDNGGQTEAAGYPVAVLRTRLKQIKVYILVQQGKMDLNYTSPASITVGDGSLNACPLGSVGGVGRIFPITAALKHYHWKVLALSVTPRNIR